MSMFEKYYKWKCSVMIRCCSSFQIMKVYVL